jgi:DNA-binding transcriptional ArsR family regulator
MQPKGCIITPVPHAFDMDRVFKALADASRRQLLDQLSARSGQTLGDLCSNLEMTRQAVTKHLKLLEEAGLVVSLWRGREKLHYLNPAPIHEIAERWIDKYQRGRVRLLAELKSKLESQPESP